MNSNDAVVMACLLASTNDLATTLCFLTNYDIKLQLMNIVNAVVLFPSILSLPQSKSESKTKSVDFKAKLICCDWLLHTSIVIYV